MARNEHSAEDQTQPATKSTAKSAKPNTTKEEWSGPQGPAPDTAEGGEAHRAFIKGMYPDPETKAKVGK